MRQSWDPVAGGGVLTNPITDRFIVTWNAAPLPNTGIVATFQVILFGNGVIHMTYPAVPGTPPGGYLTGISPGASGASRVTTIDFSLGGSGSISAAPNFEPLVQVFGSSAAPLVNMNAVARKFFALQADLFDQLVVFSTFPQTVLGGGFDQRMRRAAAGTGQSAFNLSSFAGSRGRLHGLINLRQLSLWPDDPFGPPGALITLIKSLAHETGHSWLSYVRFDDGGVCSDLLLDEPGAHWSFFHNDDASFMGGNTWKDNGDGSFTTIDAWGRYGQLDLYLMGHLAPPDVMPFFFLRDPSTVDCVLSSAGTGPRSCVSKIGVSVTGSRQNVTLAQVVTCAGSRSPATGFSEINPTARWNQAFILLIPPAAGASSADLFKLDKFRMAFEPYFSEATGGRGTVVTTLPTVPTLASALLPASRSVQVGNTATAFATVINLGPGTAAGCVLSPRTPVPAVFNFQTTNSTTNQVTGSPNAAVDIQAGAAQSFVFSYAPTSAFAPADVALNFWCANTAPAPINSGLNTLLLSGSTTPVPDVVALGATSTNDGILNISPSTQTGAFAVATVNVGTGASITAFADTGPSSLPVSILLCQTDPTTGQCRSAIGPSVTVWINAGDTPTFAIFVIGLGTIPFDPANNRIFIRFMDGDDVTRGATSVAVRTQ